MPARFLDTIEITPPRELIAGGFLHPVSTTILHGPGGAGKGNIAVDSIRKLIAEGMRVYIGDWEQHEQEWAARLSGIPTGTVLYDDPVFDILQYRPTLQSVLIEHSVDYVVVDSAARSAPEPLRNQTDAHVARTFFGVLRELHIPALLIAHTRKARDEGEFTHTPYPYGSVQWYNQSRLVYSAIPQEADVGFSITEVRCMKSNDREKPGMRRYTKDWLSGEMFVDVLDTTVFNLSRALRLLLQKTNRAMRPAEAAIEIQAEYPKHVDKASRIQVERALQQMVRNGKIAKVHAGYIFQGPSVI